MRRDPGPEPPRTARRVAWFIALWLAGVAAVGLVAYAIRLAMGI